VDIIEQFDVIYTAVQTGLWAGKLGVSDADRVK
jgi:hypothetical protein